VLRKKIMVDILHTPLGHEHPYMQPAGRTLPARAAGRRPFTIGIIHSPARRRSIGDSPQRGSTAHPYRPSRLHSFPAGEYRDEGLARNTLASNTMAEQYLWRAPLTAPERGRTLTYWIEADGQRGPQFTLRGEAWQLEPGGIALEASESGRSVMQLRRDVTVAPPEVTPLPRVESVEWLTDGSAAAVRVSFACAPTKPFSAWRAIQCALPAGEKLDISLLRAVQNQQARLFPIPFCCSRRIWPLVE